MGEHHYAPVPIIDRVAAVLDMVMETPDGVRPGELLRAEGLMFSDDSGRQCGSADRQCACRKK